MCHQAHIISNWFVECEKAAPEAVGMWWIHIGDEQPTDLQELRDANMSIWTNISEKCFQHLVERMTRRIKAVLKAKEVPARWTY